MACLQVAFKIVRNGLLLPEPRFHLRYVHTVRNLMATILGIPHTNFVLKLGYTTTESHGRLRCGVNGVYTLANYVC